MRKVLPFLLAIASVTFAAFGPGTAVAQNRNRDVPYTTYISVVVNNANAGFGVSPDVIPANKRLVIEYVSVSASGTQNGDVPSVWLQDLVAGASRTYWIPLALHPGPVGTYRGSQPVKLYVDGDGRSGPVANCGKSFLAGSVSCSITLSGYLTDK